MPILRRYWPSLGIFAFLSLISIFWLNPNWKSLFNQLLMFFSGEVYKIPVGYNDLLEVMRTVIPLILLTLSISFSLGLIIRIIKGKGELAPEFLEEREREGYHALKYISFTCVEELFARWLFLGVLASWLVSPIAFYILLFVGNSLWALAHLTKYQPHSRSLIRVLPQFVSGFLFAFIFVKYGLLITILAHVTWNAITVASWKIQKINWKDFTLAGYYGIGFALAYWLATARDINWNDLSPWLKGEFIPLMGFGFWDYLLVILVISLGLNFIVSLACVDRLKEMKLDSWGKIEILLAPIIFVSLIFLAWWIVGLVVSSPISKALIIVLLLISLVKTPSLSAMSRLWFTGFVPSFICVCIVVALGFWTALGVIIVWTIVECIGKIIGKIFFQK